MPFFCCISLSNFLSANQKNKRIKSKSNNIGRMRNRAKKKEIEKPNNKFLNQLPAQSLYPIKLAIINVMYVMLHKNK